MSNRVMDHIYCYLFLQNHTIKILITHTHTHTHTSSLTHFISVSSHTFTKQNCIIYDLDSNLAHV